MARTHAVPAQETLPPAERDLGTQFQQMEEGKLEVPNVTAGMVNRAPRDEVPPGSARLILNGRVRDDWTGRRPGTVSFGPVKPNALPVLAVVTFVAESGSVFIVRITTESFHVLSADHNTWIEFDIQNEDGDSITFSGLTHRLSFAQFFDNLFIADDAQNRLWAVDFFAQTVKQIKGAPRAKYITMFGDRIIAANLRKFVGGVRPGTLQWSANADPFDWDSVSAGFEDLAAQNIGDEITGLFGFERELLILRRRSIWQAERQPFAAAPFRFQPTVDNIGCDLPHTAARVPTGIIFADQRTREVYFYRPGALPEGLAAGVNRDLYEDLGRLSFAQGAYDPFEKEYHLGLAQSDAAFISRVWVYSLERQAWSLDDSPTISAIGSVSLPGVSPAIDDLVGTINEQFPLPTGTIDDYIEGVGFRPTILKGTSTGEVILQSYVAGVDWDNEDFDFTFRSPNLGSVTQRRALKALSLTTEADSTGLYTLGHLKEEAGTLKNSKSAVVEEGRQNLRIPKKSITGNDLFWEVQSSAPGFRLYSWWARVLEKGSQRR